jgi:hypothetical protein
MKVNHIFTFIDISKWICSGDEIKFWKVFFLCLFYLENFGEENYYRFQQTLQVKNERKKFQETNTYIFLCTYYIMLS